ncbi:MAG: TldD/PmbA family protein [Moraxellaceae bacterium]|nr:TldD/PmbA family protein [Pseudobdellovibrionaceae bacterium]
MSYLNFLVKELADVKLDCDFWDVRIEDTVETLISSIQGEITTCTASPSLGAFIRVRKSGFWLYQSTTQLNDIKNILKDLQSSEVPVTHKKFTYRHPKSVPFISLSATAYKFSDISIDEKSKVILNYSHFVSQQKNVNSVRMSYKDMYKVKSYFNSVGTQFEYDFNQGGIAFRFTLKEGENIFEDYQSFYASTFSQLLNKYDSVKCYIESSQEFISAPAIAPGKYNVLMNSDVAGVFTHESFGHKSEADFMLGNEDNLTEWKIGKKIASDCLTIADQGNFENTSGYCPIDDEGIPAQKNYLIKNGILAGRLHSVETAHVLDEKPTGNGRAMSFEFEPIVRMTSTFIEAGTDSLDNIIKKSEGAVLVEGYKHGSGLSTFTIAPKRGYIIQKDGSKKPVKLSVISGFVNDTLNNIIAVSSNFELNSGALGGCGKMDQWPLPVAHGGPYILVKDMQVS